MGSNSLDAELGVWHVDEDFESAKVCMIDGCCDVSFSADAFFVGMPCTRVDRYRASPLPLPIPLPSPPPSPPTPSNGMRVARGSGVRGFVVPGGAGSGSQLSSLSNDTESTVASRFKQVGVGRSC